MWKTRYLLIKVSMTFSVIWMMLPLISSCMMRSDSSETKRPILNPLDTKNLSGCLPNRRMAAFLSFPSGVMRFRFSRMVSVLSSREMPGIRPDFLALLMKKSMAFLSMSFSMVASFTGMSSQLSPIFLSTKVWSESPLSSWFVAPLR